ncbi:hypothetical protein AGABI2DRAFT_120219 [Agaricus bisporus var. bisporus H97]|uniref:hypothetical protein n=1 Tax=Agaricus bisporus var. bisporus (strain H97 / ATCC MYA-4626 / FGSC 10389) TaxID=936046 RepID=UPI00029F60E0|nr:hypothetical protein AGABI2DRAFT_120219 [Agaricus bisporus var. bisporus H97]EKV45253.1 hypothetical protein AGABI2DRAFT_120219 [Agaricus bisporus var. bisporus H97]
MADDSEHGHNSVYLPYFDLNNFAWRAPRPQEIEQRRANLDDLLIFDILLRSGSVRSPDILYPPHNEQSLLRLLEAIEKSNYDTLKKDCLVYFLLKWHQDGREDRFAMQKSLPPQFTILADAYWHLDSGINVARGVSILADARLNRDYASKILHAISLSSDAHALIRRYVRTAKPPLMEPDDIELYALALAESSLLEAWQFQRTFHESNEVRPRLMQKLLEWCVAPKPRPSALMQLLSLPLSKFEESILHSYVLRPPTTLPLDALPLLQDLVCVRMIQLGRYVEAIRMDREFTSLKAGLNTRQAQERSKMVQDLYDALPAVERTYIDLELASPPSGIHHRAGQKPPPGEDVDMSLSWEEVRPPDLQASASKLSTSRTIPERANAPRFGGPIPSVPTLPTIPTPSPLAKSFGGLTSTPRQNPSPPSFTSPSGSRPHPSLSNTAGRLVLGTLPHVSSPLTGAKLSTPTSNNSFVSANQQPNAFYKPPPRTNGHAPPIFPAVQSKANGSPAIQKPEDAEAEDANMKEEETQEQEVQEQVDDHHEMSEPKPTEERQELGFSVFENEISSRASARNKRTGASSKTTPISESASASMKRKVPGSFSDGDEDEEMDGVEHHTGKTQESEGEEESISGRAAQPRKSLSTRSTASRGYKKAKPKRNESRDSKRRRNSPQPTLPGSLMEEVEEEEEDHVAPLRSTKSTSRNKSGRLSRGSTASDLADELGEGVQTRRRSSRLSTGASTGSVDGDMSPRKSTRTKKPTVKKASAVRKKRTN